MPGAGIASVWAKEAGIATGRRAMGKSSPSSMTLDSVLSSSELDKQLISRNVIPDLARAMWTEQKRYLGNEFYSKYGKDPKYTKQVEQDF